MFRVNVSTIVAPRLQPMRLRGVATAVVLLASTFSASATGQWKPMASPSDAVAADSAADEAALAGRREAFALSAPVAPALPGLGEGIRPGFLPAQGTLVFNGMVGLLPRRYIASELFEGTQRLQGADAQTFGTDPVGGANGELLRVLPKRAPAMPLTRTSSLDEAGRSGLSVDLARRFGSQRNVGVRINAALRDGSTGLADEQAKLRAMSLGTDWRQPSTRVTLDVGWQAYQLRRADTRYTLVGVDRVPSAPEAPLHLASSGADIEDLYGAMRGEADLSGGKTVWLAGGWRVSTERSSQANIDVVDAQAGTAISSILDRTRSEWVQTGEAGIRGPLPTLGDVRQEWSAAVSAIQMDSQRAYQWNFGGTRALDLYAPDAWPQIDLARWVDMNIGSAPRRTRSQMLSVALADTLRLPGDDLTLTLGLRQQMLRVQESVGGQSAVAGVAGSGIRSESSPAPVVGLTMRLAPRLQLVARYAAGLSQGELFEASAARPESIVRPYRAVVRQVGLQMTPADAEGLSLQAMVYALRRPHATSLGASGDGLNAGATGADGIGSASAAVLAAAGGGAAAGDASVAGASAWSASAGSAASAASAAMDASRTGGSDRHVGLNLRAQAPLGRGLRMGVDWTWRDARQTGTGDARTEGRRVAGTPGSLAQISAAWAVPAMRTLSLDGRLVYGGSSEVDDMKLLEVPAWTRVDIGARWRTQWLGQRLTLRARIENVTNKRYWAVDGAGGSDGLTVGMPRTVSLSANIAL